MEWKRSKWSEAKRFKCLMVQSDDFIVDGGRHCSVALVGEIYLESLLFLLAPPSNNPLKEIAQVSQESSMSITGSTDCIKNAQKEILRNELTQLLEIINSKQPHWQTGLRSE